MNNQKFKEWLDLISSLLKVFIPAKKDNWRTFIEELNKCDKEYIRTQLQMYKAKPDTEKVTWVRIRILEIALSRRITYEEAESIFEENRNRYNYTNRNMFSVLYPFYYNQFKDEAKEFLNELTNACVINVWKNRVEWDYNDFDWWQNYWKDEVYFWIISKEWSNEKRKWKRARQFRVTTHWEWEMEIGMFYWESYYKSKVFKNSELTLDVIFSELRNYLDEILRNKPWENDEDYTDNNNDDIFEEFKQYIDDNLKPYQETDTYKLQIDARKAFLEDHPFDDFINLKLEDYVIGSWSKTTFCYWFEFWKYRYLWPWIWWWSAWKYWIYYSKDQGWYADRNWILLDKPFETREKTKKEIIKLVNDIKNADSLNDFNDNIEDLKSMQLPLLKLLNAYCPNKIIWAASLKSLRWIADVFHVDYEGLSSIKLNYQITKTLFEHLPFLADSEPEWVSHMVRAFWLQKTWQWEETEEENEEVIVDPKDPNTYSKYEFLDEVFMTENQYDTIADTLHRKKNIILMGAPWVWKTFCAKKLMYSIMWERAKDRIVTVQFHQSYSYEDFIQWYRPNDEWNFELKDGVFYNLVEEARKNFEESIEKWVEPKKYCMIIDEINRWNLSKVFWELMMLIEADKRKKDRSVKLTYSDKDFYIPENLYIIWTMNTADRSLTMVDYALRRRFAFIQLEPAFSNIETSNKLKSWLINRDKIDSEFVDSLIDRYARLNKFIESSLWKWFCIWHSYFIWQNLSDNPIAIYRDIVQFEIKPLLDEYYFDDKNKVEEALWIIDNI